MADNWARIVMCAVMLCAVVVAGGCEEPEDSSPPAADDALAFATSEDHLTVRVDGTHEPMFIKGINLGVALPGTLAGQLAATKEDYTRWLEMMGEMGFNVVRIYTLHYPRFYEAVREYNLSNHDDPIYVLHGVWLDEKPDQEGPTDLFDLTEDFEQEIVEVVDCVHGDCEIGHRYGKAYGDYEVDISRWVLGWIIGREVHPEEVQHTNEVNEETRSLQGVAFEVDDADPVEVWFAQKLDLLVERERTRYGVERPVSVSSWPTLDPLDHRTSGSDYSSEDIASFDATNIDPVDAPAGIFATYHAYPYYPDYIPDDPDYREYADEQGPNSYMGYLFRLKDHYDEMPLLIGETGVPSSWGSAHWGYEDMDHGGHDEIEQGEVASRLMQTVHATNGAGGAFFAWIDEWWKPTWITDPYDFPIGQRSLWHNVTAAEQNFGLLASDLGEPDFNMFSSVSADEPVKSVEASADAAYFHVRLHLDEALGEGDQLVVGFDTYRDDLGESILPDDVQTENRNEFALVVEPHDTADLYVTLAYDLFGREFYNSDDGQKYRSTATDGAPWRLVRWQNSQERGSNDGQFWFDATFHDIGHLRIRGADEEPTSHDAVVVGTDRVDIRIPWTLLHVVDPSLHKVVHDDRQKHYELQERNRRADTTTTDGIALSISVNNELVAESDRFLWDGWQEAPETTERIKRGAPILSDTLDELPYWIE